MAAQGQLRDLRNDQRLRRFLLPNVHPTGRELGMGAYGSVEEVKVSGLVCAGKKIHEALVRAANPSIAERYVEECQLMSDLRHPHIVQFLGICFQPSSRLPVLLMERLHTSLDDLLTQHTRHPPLLAAPDIPFGQKRSFLVDIARGLHFLHSHSPSVIHRDLTAKNVLLNTSMTAKISDLGNARIVDYQPGQLPHTMSRVPGTPVYMPPEAFDTHSRYGPRLDLFSFGHLALYILIQVFPWDLLPPTYTVSLAPRRLFGRRCVIGRTEVERRRPYITQLHQQLGKEHHLVQLVEQCLANDAEDRPSAEEVLRRLEEMEIDDPYQNLTRLDMMVMIGDKEEEIQQTVQESQQKDREIQQRDEEIQRKEAEIGQNQQVIEHKEEQIQLMGEEIRLRDAGIQCKVVEIEHKEQVIQKKEEQIQQMLEDMQQREDNLQEKNEENKSLLSRVQRLQAQVQGLEVALQSKTSRVATLSNRVDQLESEKERTQAQHTSEVEALSQQISSLREDNSNLSSLVEAKASSLQVKEQQIEELRRELVVKERLVEDTSKELEAKQQQTKSVTQIAKAHAKLVHSLQDQLFASEQGLISFQDQLRAKDQELSALQHRIAALQQKTEGTAQEHDALQLELVSLREGLQTKDAEITVQSQRVRTTEEEVRVKAAEITAKDALLQSKEKIVQSLRREVESLRQRGAEQVTLLHPGGASLEWKSCADLPVWIDNAQAVQLKTKVYVQGNTDSLSNDSTLYQYEVHTDAWVSMKSPTRWPALTIYHSQLVLVGGMESNTGRVTDQLWVLHDGQTWTQPLPHMPTGRWAETAASSGDHLVVAGGYTNPFVCTDSVEVYDGLQWMRADPLPVTCRDIKSTYHSGMWYLMGGSGQSTSVFYTSLHSLIEKATQRLPTLPDGSNQQSVWKALQDLPYILSSSTTLGGALLTVGRMDRGGRSSSVCVYSPLTHSWFKIGDMPEEVRFTCSVALTTRETMVIGGRTGSASSHVHKVSLKLQQ